MSRDANPRHLDMIMKGVDVWNEWRQEEYNNRSDERPNLWGVNFSDEDLSKVDFCDVYFSDAFFVNTILTEADFFKANLAFANMRNAQLHKARLSKAELFDADLGGANLSEADLSGANLHKANLKGANLRNACLLQADLTEGNLEGADLREADLSEANLSEANLRNVNLSGAKLNGANLVRAHLEYANITGCSIHGISAWNVRLEGAKQANLIITDKNEPIITVDNLKVAQFIYLLITNSEIREVIDTVSAKVVLILGRFTERRKKILDTIKDELRRRNYLPILFDFEKPTSRDITETVSTLAHMTEAKSIPHELQTIVPHLLSVPIIPLLQIEEKEYAMYEHFPRYPQVVEIYHYYDSNDIVQSIQEQVIDRAELKAKEVAST
jgi:uncharacterized protein YjbI with pentapeptide repeats